MIKINFKVIFSKKIINIFSILFSILFVFNIFNFLNLNNFENNKKYTKDDTKKIIKDDNFQEEKIISNNVLWYIEIPSINLKAPIREGVDSDNLKYYVGHFSDTAICYGNIGLAAHNRGYENNYFENLKELKIGDEIKYKNNDFEEKYYINKIEIIRNTDWSYLEQSNDNKITLITCVENQPALRRCVQGLKK